MIRAKRLAYLAISGSAALVSLAAQADAQSPTIKLKLRDGDLVVQGALINFDGKTFVIDDRAYGRMTFDAARFTCVDGPCPRGALEVVAPSAPDDRAEPPETQILLSGSQSVAGTLAPALVRAFAQDLGQAATRILGQDSKQVAFKLARAPQKLPMSFNIDPKSSGAGFDALAKGTADVAMADRAPNDTELRALASISRDVRGPGSEHVIALDGVVFVAHPSRGALTLTTAELQGILTGSIRDWSTLRSAPGPIELILPSATSSAMEQVRRSLLQPGNKPISADATVGGSVGSVADAVARSPNAIGITTRSSSDNVAMVTLRGACGLDAVASDHAIKAADYPLTRKLYLYTALEPQKPVIQAFARFATSDQGQVIAQQQNFVDQSIGFMSDESHAGRFAYAARHAAALKREADWQAHQRDLVNAKRLTATFRFPSGRSELDAKTDQDLTRLAAYLADPRFNGREILIVGYADSIGRYDLNATLALNRAQRVRTALIQRGGAALQGRTLTARGHGPHAPVLCNDDAFAQDVNRRVEIWIRN